ncbi:MAG: imidazole glycerol phosphate synthase subunit HisH [Magnetospirillum sp. WYHS-4]
MTIAIVDYGSGNLRSCAKAFERAAADLGLSVPVVVTADPGRVAAADRIVLPGVGAFGDCRRGLEALPGMIETLERQVLGKGRPFFGICVGMQLMATRGLEHGNFPGLGWIPGVVQALEPTDSALKIPHMGWNELRLEAADHPLFAGLADGSHVYFVHSYALRAQNRAHILAVADYGGPVTAVVGRDNMVGTQFHPEKSQAVGLKLIANFLKWTP